MRNCPKRVSSRRRIFTEAVISAKKLEEIFNECDLDLDLYLVFFMFLAASAVCWMVGIILYIFLPPLAVEALYGSIAISAMCFFKYVACLIRRNQTRMNALTSMPRRITRKSSSVGNCGLSRS
jgi:hypothetical protein